MTPRKGAPKGAPTWATLQKGDTLLCPRDGVAERVVYVRPYVNGKVSVRTSRHDHFRPGTEEVETYR